jgi:hypothetical protein
LVSDTSGVRHPPRRQAFRVGSPPAPPRCQTPSYRVPGIRRFRAAHLRKWCQTLAARLSVSANGVRHFWCQTLLAFCVGSGIRLSGVRYSGVRHFWRASAAVSGVLRGAPPAPRPAPSVSGASGGHPPRSVSDTSGVRHPPRRGVRRFGWGHRPLPQCQTPAYRASGAFAFGVRHFWRASAAASGISGGFRRSPFGCQTLLASGARLSGVRHFWRQVSAVVSGAFPRTGHQAL